MHHPELIQTITAALAAALVFGYATHRIGLSPIVGYLLAGIAVGPAMPGIIANRNLANELAEIGVVLLMFGVGLQFHIKELLAVRRVAVPGALVHSLISAIFGIIVALGFGWGWSAGLIFGLALSIASTVVLVRVLVDNHDLHTPLGHIAVGWLVVEDLFTVVVLVLLPAIVRSGADDPAAIARALGLALVKIGLLIAFVMIVGGKLIPRMLARVAATRSRELFTLAVLAVALGIALGAAMWFGVSMALGAFLAGMVVGRSDFSSRAAADALPMRDAFAVLFFVSVGMLFDPAFLIEQPLLVAVTFAVVAIGKPLAALVIVLAMRYPPRIALGVAVAMAQIGEFSFILAALGRQLGIFPEDGTNALIAVAIASISINPLLYRLMDAAEGRAKRRPRLWRWLTARMHHTSLHDHKAKPPHSHVPRPRAIVVGYGPVGRTLVRLLRESNIEPTVIELNLDVVRQLRHDGIPVVYGDATHAETLLSAGVEHAVVIMLSSSGMHGSDEAIRQARELNPNIRVLVRANHLRESHALRKVGADAVVAGEGEVALTMTEFLLQHLGATAEQIDREKARVRTELFGGPH